MFSMAYRLVGNDKAFMPGMDSAEAEGFLSIDSGSIVIA